MRRRFLAFVCCFGMLASLLPCSVKANGRTTNVNLLETPEEVAEVFYRQNASLRKSKGVTAQDQQNEIRKRVIVESAQTLENTYGAVKTYYYTVGGYQILLYDSADQAELAVTNLKKDYPGVHIFQDIPVTLEEAARDGDADVQAEIQDAAEKEDESETETEIQAFDGIHMMGMDKLKEDAKDWSGDATVAVIDSGIDEDHPWFTTRLDRKNSVNLAADGLGKDAYNDPNQGHGTHVAGIVTQATPVQVKIMAVRVFDLTGSASYTTITLGVDYAVQHNADVINMSLGFEILPGFESDDTDLMDEAFARALKAGTTVCVASGNEYTDTARSYPASSRWTIAVGSLEPVKDGNSYIRSDFSNNGTLLDFAAPGRNIFSAWIGEGETTEIASGTSMATPHLAAAAAYVKLKHPDYNQREVYSVFRDYAVDLGEPGKDTEFGYGYVDFTNYAAEDQNTAKKYQAITAPAQINKTMNDLDKPFTIDIEFSRGNGTLSFASTDEKVAKVNGSQVQVTGVGSCEIVITASETDQYYQTEERVRIRVEKGQQTITVPVTEYHKYLSDKNFKVTASIEKPGDGKLVFLANENDVLEVTEDGYVTILGTGTTQIYAVAKASDNFVRQVSDAITVTVEEDPKPQQKTAVETQESAKLKAEAASVDPTEDGEYTLTFEAKQEGSDEESMLAGYFDPKAKLTVENGKMYVTFLNTKLSDFLLDFTVASDGTYAQTEKTGFGEPDGTGSYAMYEYKMEITKPSEVNKGAALVSAMGGQNSDIGNFDKYLKTDFTFLTLEKGWSGYDASKTEDKPTGAAALNEALRDYGMDKDNDGTVTAEEVARYGGTTLDLSECNLSEIGLLRYLPSQIITLNLSNNEITAIPEGLLDNLTSLENFYIEHNKITEIPEGLFKNNHSLDWISFTGNQISSLKNNTFEGLDALTILDLEGNQIREVSQNALTGMPKLQQLSFAGNGLENLQDDVLKPLAGSLRWLFLQENNIESLPKTVEDLFFLEELYAYDNGMKDITKVDFSKLPQLQEVNFMHNEIREIPSGTFAKNEKLAGLDLYDNLLTTMSPDTLPATAVLRKLDIRLNNIQVVDRKLIMKSQSFNKFYPQKSAMSLKIEKDGENGVKWSQELSILDLLYWFDATNDAKVEEAQSVDEYREFLKDKGYEDRDIVDVLNDQYYDWKIITSIEKKNADGTYETVWKSADDDKADLAGGAFATAEKGTYRVVKDLYSGNSGLLFYRFSVFSNEVNTAQQNNVTSGTDKPNNGSNSNTNGGNNGNSANPGNTAVKKPAKVKKVTAKAKKRTAVISWKKVKGASGYEVYRSTKKNGKYKKIKTIKKAGTVRFTDKKLKKGFAYYYKVRAYRKTAVAKVYGNDSAAKKVKIK